MNLEIKVIQDNSDSFTEAIGISEQRCKELEKAFEHAHVDWEYNSEVAQEVSKICRHPTELLYLGVMIGKQIMFDQLATDGVINIAALNRRLNEDDQQNTFKALITGLYDKG